MRPVTTVPARVSGIKCDMCGKPRHCYPSEGHEDLRKLLRKLGWLCAVLEDREVDVCPACRL